MVVAILAPGTRCGALRWPGQHAARRPERDQVRRAGRGRAIALVCGFFVALAHAGNASASAPGPEHTEPSAPKPAGPHLLYVHTEGLEIVVSPNRGASCVGDAQCGLSDAAQNTSWLPGVDTPTIYLEAMMADRDDEDRQRARLELISELKRYFRGIGIMPTLERPPAEVEYSMVVVGGNPADLGLSAGIAGLAPLDCDDANPRDIAFVFANAISDVASMARVAAQEAAHSYGLEHVALRQFVMHPEPIGGTHGFSAACLPLSPSPQLSNPDGIKCVHTCASLGHQNSFEELLERFGDNPDNPLPPDAAPPEVAFSSPASGAHYPETPAKFRVDVDADDGPMGGGVVRAFLAINGGPAVEDPTYPFAFHVQNLGPGRYDLRTEVYDLAGNLGTDERTIYVGVAAHDQGPGPIPGPDAIVPHLEDRSGEPVTCESDAACYEGTVCIDDICTHAPDGCSLGPHRGDSPGRWFGLGCLVFALTRRRAAARLSGMVQRCRAN